jgi:glycosyltransferase involved in cell wall biosynthesis
MHLGTAWAREGQDFYRARVPLTALEQRGHTIVWPDEEGGGFDLARLSQCDVVHVHQCLDAEARLVLEALSRRGVAFTWDGWDGCVPEDDPAAEPPGLLALSGGGSLCARPSPLAPGRRGRLFEHAMRVARCAQVVTVPNETLAQRYRECGIERVEVIPDCLPTSPRRRRRHEGIVIGWVSESGRPDDPEQRELAEVLPQIQRAHPDVWVECVGIDLELAERYRHHAGRRADDLPALLARFDIGVVPLADTSRNRSRSDVVLKEYAASGVPWLASQLSAYGGLGPGEGGTLVSAGGWFETLDRLIRDGDVRRRLAENGRNWGRTQTVDSVVDRWEAVFREAVDRRYVAPS